MFLDDRYSGIYSLAEPEGWTISDRAGGIFS